jgi:YegS/Rv2252/BmrU family lipid kinase
MRPQPQQPPPPRKPQIVRGISKKSCVIIYNPRAGKLKRRGSDRLERVRRILIEAGYETTLAATPGPGAAVALARGWAADGVGLILAAGGDGTINEIAEGMMHSAVPLGILPAGTANVLAMETGMSLNLETAARDLLTYTPERVSVGRLDFNNGSPARRHFLLMAGVGLDARMIYNLSAPLKNNLGKIAYWIAGFGLMGRRLEEFSAKIDDRDYRCSFALVSKVRNYGGNFEIARDTSLFDDQFEVVLFQGHNSVRYLRYFAGVVMNRLQGMKGVRVLRARTIHFSPVRDTRVYMQVDGEYAGHLPGSVEIVRDAITLLLPPLYKRQVKVTGPRLNPI